jgi:putative ABC transport system permease protein
MVAKKKTGSAGKSASSLGAAASKVVQKKYKYLSVKLDPNKPIAKQINLPLKQAVLIAVNSLRIRFWRSMISMGGVLLGIAFLMSVLTTNLVMNALAAQEDLKVAEGIVVEEFESLQLIWLVSLSLIVCVVGIVNSMLMAVTERYREIGTMKCLGALDKFIIELFILESGFQGLVGSFAGALIGVGFILAKNSYNYGMRIFGWLDYQQLLIYVGCAVLGGMFLAVLGAIYPASRAAQMQPADAMRVDM